MQNPGSWLDDTVGAITRDLALAAGGQDSAYYLSHALYSLQRFVSQRNPERLAAVQRDDLLAALEAVRLSITGLPASQQFLLTTAFRAAAVLVCYWADPVDKRAERGRQSIQDAHDYVRWLRNTAHNVSLLADLAPRIDQHEFRSPICVALWDQCVGQGGGQSPVGN
jgi:hypothetical protein